MSYNREVDGELLVFLWLVIHLIKCSSFCWLYLALRLVGVTSTSVRCHCIVSVQIGDDCRSFLLHSAVNRMFLDIVSELLSCGADVNCR